MTFLGEKEYLHPHTLSLLTLSYTRLYLCVIHKLFHDIHDWHDNVNRTQKVIVGLLTPFKLACAVALAPFPL